VFSLAVVLQSKPGAQNLSVVPAEMTQQDLHLLLIHQIGQTGGLQGGIWTFYLSTSSSLGSPAADPTKSSVPSDDLF
jgi:hypothetical protein